jgi:formate/nitrite transporter FocA (FNT family)
VPFVAQLAAGSYYMNIGAILNDAAGDQFVWSQGQNVQDFWFTDDNGQYNWGDWRQLPTFIGNTAGGAFVLSAPAPGAIALLGMAGLIGRRRR